MKQYFKISLAAMVWCLFVSCAFNTISAQAPATIQIVKGKKIEMAPAMPAVETTETIAERGVGCPPHPDDIPWPGGTDIIIAVNTSLDTWMSSGEFVPNGSGNIAAFPPSISGYNTSLPGPRIHFLMNQFRSIMSNSTLDGCNLGAINPVQYGGDAATTKALAGTFNGWKSRRNLDCELPSVHAIDTPLVGVAKCLRPGVFPIGFQKWANRLVTPNPYPTYASSQAAFGGQSNALSYEDPNQATAQDYRDLVDFWFYASIFMDGASNHGHLHFLLSKYANTTLKVTSKWGIVSPVTSNSGPADGQMGLWVQMRKYPNTQPPGSTADRSVEIPDEIYDSEFSSEDEAEWEAMSSFMEEEYDRFMEMVFAYPNPTSGSFTVNAPLGATLTVMNPAGQRITTTTTTDTATNLDIADQPTGIYFLQVVTTDGFRNTLRIAKN
jgi:hypothetical protein